MKKVFFIVSILVIWVAGVAPSVEAQVREERQVNGNFDEISVSSGVDLILKQGDTFEIIVEADEDVINELVTELKGNRLNVYLDGGVFNWFFNAETKVYVTLPEVSKLFSSGGADLKSAGEIRTDRLEINSSGGADAEVSVSANTVILHCSGGADIRVDGNTDILKAESSGGADIFAKELHAKKVFASSSGGADLEVYVEEEIEASASGGADVDYYGPGKDLKISETGGGDVRRH
jgi:hypothetical protein